MQCTDRKDLLSRQVKKTSINFSSNKTAVINLNKDFSLLWFLGNGYYFNAVVIIDFGTLVLGLYFQA